MARKRTYWSLSSRPKIRSPYLYVRQNLPNNAPKLREVRKDLLRIKQNVIRHDNL
jgi:hypothetical protein